MGERCQTSRFARNELQKQRREQAKLPRRIMKELEPLLPDAGEIIHKPGDNYCKVRKFSDTRKFCCNLLKIHTRRPNLKVFCQKDEHGIANSEDPDQAAPLRAV